MLLTQSECCLHLQDPDNAAVCTERHRPQDWIRNCSKISNGITIHCAEILLCLQILRVL